MTSTTPADHIPAVEVPPSPLAGDVILGQKQGRQFMPLFMASWFGVTLALGAMLGAAIPKFFLFFDEAQKESNIAIVAAVGGIVVIIITPLFGRLSDRTASKWGMRKPWMLAGIIVGVIGSIGLAYVNGLFWFVVSWSVVQIGFGATNVALHALLADQIPARIRARVAAAASITVGVATILSAAVVAALPNDQRALWFLIPGVVGGLFALPLVFGYKDAVRTAAPAPFTFRDILSTYWLSPARYRDFFWAWISRLLITMAIFTVQVFLLFLIVDTLGVAKENASGVLTETLLVYFLASFVSAPFFAWFSDRLRRRKAIIWISNIFAALALVFMMFAGGIPLFLIGAAILGLAQGSFISVDIALTTEVMPSATEAGKDLGIVALSYQLPQVIGPLLGALAVGLVGYTGLFAMAAVLVLLGGLAVIPIRSVR